jgi:sulfite exporter TauE/SafE
MWQGWVNGILGLWLIVTAFLGFGSSGNLWNDLIVGIIVAILGYSITKPKGWQGWIAFILGLWLIIVGLFIGGLRVGGGALWNNLIVGIIVAITGFGALGGKETTVTKS